MADKYFRLVSFVVNVCTEPLRKLFLILAKADAVPLYTTLDAYLAFKKPDINNLKRQRKIRNDQYDLLFPGHGTADEMRWDVSLLVTLITELFAPCLQPIDKFFLEKEIRGIRNELQHLPNTSEMSDTDFNTYWGRLETAAISLANQVFTTKTELAAFREKIEDTKTRHLPDLGDCLRMWYEETIKQMTCKMEEMSDTISEMKAKLDKVETNSSETTALLRNVTIQKPGAAGKGNKRQRIMVADGILAHLQASFATKIKELPDDFNAPAEVADIRTKLRDKHHVVVTGSYNSRYFEAALAAITGMDYNHQRCVEMQKSSDWRHIDPEDVDFVLCRDPFGSISFDVKKTKGIVDIFNSMMHTVNGDSGETLDIMIVTDFRILTECKRLHEHDMLDEVIKIFDATTEEQPADLTSVCDRGQNINFSTSSVMTNILRVMTDNFLRQFSISSRQVDRDVLHEARSKFKAKKAVVLTGPKKCGKTSVAVALASSYQPSQCLLLTRPNDVKLIDYQNICLVIIDEFAGKYRYETSAVYKWFEMFDHLHNAVSAGHLNVIITCETSKLNKCSKISLHSLLVHRVVIAKHSINFKQEMLDTKIITDKITNKRKRGRPSHEEVQMTNPDTPSEGVRSVPLSERQQLAMLMQLSDEISQDGEQPPTAHSQATRVGSPRLVQKVPSAFCLVTTPITKISRYLCKDLLRPRHAAKSPYLPINIGIIKTECLARLTERGGVFKLPNHSSARSCMQSVVSRLGIDVNQDRPAILERPDGPAKQPEKIFFPSLSRSTGRGEAGLFQVAGPSDRGPSAKSWTDDPDDVYFMASSETKKLRKQLQRHDVKMAARNPLKSLVGDDTG